MRWPRLPRCLGRTPPRARPLPYTTCGRRPPVSKRSSVARRQVREPDLDERPDRVLEARLAGELERLRPALAGLLRVDALLQPVVAGDEQLLDALARVVYPLHKTSLTRHILVPVFSRRGLPWPTSEC